MKTYKIVRRFFNDRSSAAISTNLTLEQAQAHFRDPETSSRTCTNEVGKLRTETYGPWFDCIEEEASND